IVHSQGFCAFRGNIFTGHICNRAWHRALKKLEGGTTLRESIFNAVATTLEYTTYGLHRGCAVVAVSQRVADDIVRYYRCSAPIHVIHHGVDAQLFSPDSRRRWRSDARALYGLPENEMVFLYIGD